MTSAAVRSIAVALVLFIIDAPIAFGGFVLVVLFCYAVLSGSSSFEIISLSERVGCVTLCVFLLLVFLR